MLKGEISPKVDFEIMNDVINFEGAFRGTYVFSNEGVIDNRQ